jgi:ribonuclease BN (tRNA processing enzyme)
VRIILAPSTASPNGPEQYLISYLLNETVAVDAGCLGVYRTPAEQSKVRHVFLSHSHMDHVASLPLFLENVYDPEGPPVNLYASADTLDSLARDMFNGRQWPDFLQPPPSGAPFAKMHTLQFRQPVRVDGLTLTPIPVNHTVPTVGFIVEDDRSAVVIASDTAATDEIWEHANRLPHLRAVFLEAAFPEHQAALADAAKHFTPLTFAHELRKLKTPVTVVTVHIKARYHAEVIAEVTALALPKVEIARYGVPYDL